MTTTRAAAVSIAAVMLTLSALPAQPSPARRSIDTGFALTTIRGDFHRGRPLGLDAERGVLIWRDAGAEVDRDVPLAELLVLHGPAAREAPDAALVALVGGELLRGAVVGGDAAGETFVLRSAVLGSLALRIDRVAAIAFGSPAGPPALDQLVVPAGADEGEALFVPARRGLDVIVGSVHRFSERGVLFEARRDDGPSLRSYGSLAGFALRDGDPREQPATADLATVAGDRLGVDWTGFDGRSFAFDLEGDRTVSIDAAQVSSLSLRSERVRFLSDLSPIDVRERGYFAEAGEVPYPFRLDRAVDGGPLRVAGLGFAKGIGVHAASSLAFRVPDGVEAVVGLVAIDDTALELPVRGAALARVKLGDATLFQTELRAGQPPQSLGRLAVEAGATLRLEVDFGPGLDFGDRVDWLDVAFVR